MTKQRAHGLFILTQTLGSLFLFCAGTAILVPAQTTLTTLVDFEKTNGDYPAAALTEAINGNLYGTTYHGGSGDCFLGCGTLFEIIPTGTLTTLHSFCSKAGCLDGNQPVGSLVQATNGALYGVTEFGGNNYSECPGRCGTIFKISPTGAMATIYNFCSLPSCADGAFPMAGLVQGTNGKLYGTTTDRGANNAGTVFEITSTGKLTPLYNFCSQTDCADGGYAVSPLVQAVNGSLYGTTLAGGNNGCSGGCGTVFEMTPRGKLTTLFTFDGPDGAQPTGLIQAANGEFYGVTAAGGNSSNCPTAYGEGCGTVFEITPKGKLTTLYSFCSLTNCADGIGPNGPLVQGSDGNFYGTTSSGGPDGWGTAFEITSAGTLTTLYSFCSLANCADGADPGAGLLQLTNGDFYGTTTAGGDVVGGGTIFSLSTGLGSFVAFLRNPAKVGEQFGILGQGLTDTTSVSFNGTPATFTVNSDTLLIATVPAGAQTGYVTVITPASQLTSNVPFDVIP